MDILLNLRTFLFFLIFYRILNSVVKIVDREHTKPAIFPADYQQIFDYIEISHRGNMLFSWILDNVVVVWLDNSWKSENTAFIGSEEVP